MSIDVSQFFLGMEDYVILRMDDDFPNVREGGDVDILCRDKEVLRSFIFYQATHGKQNYYGEFKYTNGHIHIDFCVRCPHGSVIKDIGKGLLFRFDIIESLEYKNFTVKPEFTEAVLNSRQKITRNGVEFYVPAPEFDLAVRLFEFKEHPEKTKHALDVAKYLSDGLGDIIEKYSDLHKRSDGKSVPGTTKHRMDYFIIWGHGLQYTEEILDIIRSNEDFDILYIKKFDIENIDNFIKALYTCDHVPFSHLKDKTRYLLSTEPKILFVLVKNNNAKEKQFGHGQFRHIQCQTVKDIKEDIRNKFNPTLDGKRSEHHVVHASDYESQVRHVLSLCGLPAMEYYLRRPCPDIDVPYYLPPFDEYSIRTVKLDDLQCNIIGQGVVPIEQTPHYKYLTGDKQPYIDYYKDNCGEQLTDDHSASKYDSMFENFRYDNDTKREPVTNGRRRFILVQMEGDKYKIVDGVHRAAILKYWGFKFTTVAMPFAKKIILLVFSKDRAMQLQAALESFLLHCSDDVEMCVIYKASNSLHEEQYQQLRLDFKNVLFQEGYDFRMQVFGAVNQYRYVMFCVDDTIFVRSFSTERIIGMMKTHTDALGFSLRLGVNTTYCYPKDVHQEVPPRRLLCRFIKYDWTTAELDFGYPLEVSSSVYRVNDILSLLRKGYFTNPNDFEGMLAANTAMYANEKNKLLCYRTSVAFAAPVNIVQTVAKNRGGNKDSESVESLAEAFKDGKRIDVDSYSGFVPESCHQEVELKFRT